MKTSINYLPEQKRDDLRRIVECVLEVLPDCEMIILYGSYARNTYVDYDQRIEYGIRTCFMSDYDILVVTSTRFQRYSLYNSLFTIRSEKSLRNSGSLVQVTGFFSW